MAVYHSNDPSCGGTFALPHAGAPTNGSRSMRASHSNTGTRGQPRHPADVQRAAADADRSAAVFLELWGLFSHSENRVRDRAAKRD